MPKIEAIVTKSLYLHSSNYHLTLTSKQLFALLEINKKKTSVQVEWSSTKLDELISNIAARVDTYNNSPILGSCQFLVSTGGYWLDRVATKNFLQSIVANSSRSYSLPITYHAAIVGKRTQLAVGSNGTIFLTFDDGLSYGNQIMDYASCYGVKVTFFELGSRVGIDSATLRRAVAEGHAIQSHGYLHAAYDYGSRSYDWQFNDIKQSINAIASVTGIVPTYFRPPGGNRSAETYKAASANGLTLILWGASSSDTAGISSDAICANVLASVHPGASVLMHSTKPTTAEAVPCIMEGMAAKGYNMQALR
jgi:peptidoglycan/xylan/chitin deacetylase (PgdA/CDA1 family)